MKKTNPKISRRLLLAAMAGALLLVAGGLILAIRTASKPTPAATPQPKGPQTDTSGSSPSPTATNTTGPTVKSPTAPTPSVAPGTSPDRPISNTLPKPTGQTLNKFTISLSSTDLKTSPAMNSSCQATTAGAYCGLRLAGPSGESKQVTPTATDAQGGNSFDWNAGTLGLTPGIWKAQLWVTQNSQDGLGDTYNLTVQP